MSESAHLTGYNENVTNVSRLKPFDYNDDYTLFPNENEEVGIFDLDREYTDIWEDGEEEKNKYRKIFEKHIQSKFGERKQSLISQGIITKLLLLFGGTAVFTFFLVGKLLLLLQSLGRDFYIANSFGIWSVPYQLLSGPLPMLILVFMLSMVAGYMICLKYMQRISKFDTRISARGSEPAYINYDAEKCRETFAIREIDEPVGVPLGVYRDMVYCMPDEPKHNQFRNKNLLYIGGSGSGKSYAGVKPLILQRIANGESFIVSDTKGALYEETAACCEAMGYRVQIFSTKQFKKSDGWNCLHDIVKAPGDKAWDMIDDLAHTLIKNSKRGEKGVQYWDDNEQDLLRSMLHYVCKSSIYPDDNNRTFGALIDLMSQPVEDINQIFMSLPSNESAYDASASFRNLNNMELKEKYRSGLANKLHMFKNPFVKAAMSYDGINIEDSVHNPTAIFLVSADDKETFDAVTSLFVSSAYMKLIEIADSGQYKGKLYRPYWFIMDELCNMAAINDLSRKISTNRSRNINFALTIQTMSQIEERYGKLFENIAGNCGTIIPVGISDDTTAKFIANKCGTFSEMTTSDMVKKPTLFAKYVIPFHKTERIEIKESKVLTEFDIKNKLKGDILALVAGKEIFRGKPYGTDMHPLAKYCKNITIDERSPDWYERFKLDHPDMEFDDEITYKPSKYELRKRKAKYAPPVNKKNNKKDSDEEDEKKWTPKSDFSKFFADENSDPGTGPDHDPGPERADQNNISQNTENKNTTRDTQNNENKNGDNFGVSEKSNKEKSEEASGSQRAAPAAENKPSKKKYQETPIEPTNPLPDIKDAEEINKPAEEMEIPSLAVSFDGSTPSNKNTQQFYEELNGEASYSDDDYSILDSLLNDE